MGPGLSGHLGGYCIAISCVGHDPYKDPGYVPSMPAERDLLPAPVTLMQHRDLDPSREMYTPDHVIDDLYILAKAAVDWGAAELESRLVSIASCV